MRRTRLRRQGPLQRRQLEIRHHALGGVVDDHLVHRRQHLAHRLQIDAPAGDLGRFLVFLIDREEALGAAFGLGDDLLAIGFGVLHDLGGLAARLGNDPVGVGLAFVALLVLIGQRPLYVEIGVAHFVGRLGLLHRHVGHPDAGVVGIERLLHQPLDLDLNLLAVGGQDQIHVLLADHFAHRAFGNRLDGLIGILDVEQIGVGVLDLPKDRELHVDDVLVAGEHQAFIGNVFVLGLVSALRADPVADIDLLLTRDLGCVGGLDRPRHMIIDARRGVADELAEAQNHALLGRADDIEAA